MPGPNKLHAQLSNLSQYTNSPKPIKICTLIIVLYVYDYPKKNKCDLGNRNIKGLTCIWLVVCLDYRFA